MPAQIYTKFPLQKFQKKRCNPLIHIAHDPRKQPKWGSKCRTRGAAADHARSRAGMVSDSDRHRSRASTDTPISTEISSKEAVFGGSSLASTLFLKACPYRAIASFHHRPPFFEIYGGDNYSGAGGLSSGSSGADPLLTASDYFPYRMANMVSHIDVAA